MISKTVEKFQKMPQAVRHIVFLYWIDEFALIIVSSFLAAFVFLETGSVLDLSIYQGAYFLGIAIGFCGWGYLMSIFRISMKFNYLRAFGILFLSFMSLLIFPHTLPFLLLFGFLNGLGSGLFWLSLHAYELTLTSNKTRDFYSSMLTAGSQALKVLSPLVAAASFILADRVFGVETFELLFWIIPAVYLLTLPFLFKLPDYIPPRISVSEMKRLIFDKKLNKHRKYYFAQSFDWSVWSVIYPIIALGSLATVTNLAIFETAIGIISLLSVIFLSHIRHEGNRIKIMLYATIGSIIAYTLLFFWEVSPYFFVIYSLMLIVLRPIFRVSEHTTDLKSIENLREAEHTSFYAGLIYRDGVLGVGRLAALTLVGFIFYITQSENFTIQFSLALSILVIALIYRTAKRVAKG